MQQRVTSRLIEDSNISDQQTSVVDVVSILDAVQDITDLASGYVECMSEAIRYLTEVENYPLEHPAVQSLHVHLEDYRKQLLQATLHRTSGFYHVNC